MRRAFAGVAAVALMAVVFAPQPVTAQRDTSTPPVESIQVRPNVYMIAGAGANVVVHVGWMGAIVVDTGAPGRSAEVLAAVRRVTDKPIRFIINTSGGAAHVGGNEALARAGVNLLLFNPGGGIFGGSAFQTNSGAAGILAHESVLRRMSATVGEKPAYPGVAWPTETYSGVRDRTLYLNGDPTQIVHHPAAHSDGDSSVLFRRADVIVAGPVLDFRHFPVIEVERGGTIDGIIAALNRLIEISVQPAPLVWHEDRTLIVPAYGRIADQADVVEYRDMVTIVRDRIQDQVKKGMTLDQIRAADPTKPYRAQYGPERGPWTNDTFIRAVYANLTARR